MEEDQAKKLIGIVIEHLKSVKGDLDSAVDFVTNLSKKNSISPDFLLELCYVCGSNEMYVLAYVFAKTSARLSIGDTKAIAHYNVGVLLLSWGGWKRQKNSISWL